MSLRALLLAAAAAASAAPAFAAAIDELEAFCLREGIEAETCGCYKGFVEENFSAREIEGAAVLAADPEVTAAESEFVGMSIGISKLTAKGYSSDEIQATLAKVSELESKAIATCDADVAPTE